MAHDGRCGGPPGPGNQVGLGSSAVDDGPGLVAPRPRYQLLFGPGDQVRLDTGANATRRVGAPLHVHFPLGNGWFLCLRVLPPSRGTGVFFPNYALLKPEIDEDEAAQLIGIDLYNLINSNT